MFHWGGWGEAEEGVDLRERERGGGDSGEVKEGKSAIGMKYMREEKE